MRVVALACVAVGLSGCFSDPLGKPGSIPTDVRLLGSWRCVSVGESHQKEGALKIMRFDDWQYYAEWKDAEEFARYRAYGNRIGDTTLLDVEELGGRFTPWPWAVVRANVGQDKKLALAIVKAKALGSADAKSVRREIRARVHDPQIYQALADCTAESE